MNRLVFLLGIAAGSLLAQSNRPIQISLDLTDAPRKILRAELHIPVTAGAASLVFPEWIPGEHGPTGPIDNLSGITFIVNGQTLPWRRDDVNMYMFHVDVPAGVLDLEAKVDLSRIHRPTAHARAEHHTHS